MFTGIVEEVGRVGAGAGDRLNIKARQALEGTRPGDSINVNGACLTVAAMEDGGFWVELMPETRRRTNLGQLRPGAGVNLERALPLGGRVGGHLVQGHIDDTGLLLSLTPQGGARLARFSAPAPLMRYLVPKGFIAVDGVSLTVIECYNDSFTVSLVSYTYEHTNFSERRPGDQVNLEVDILAKYVEKLGMAPKMSREQMISFLQQ